MYERAAHIVDCIIPDVPVRQVVLSVPFELRLLLAARADAFSAMTRLFVEQVFRWQRERAQELRLGEVESGAVGAQHRAGSLVDKLQAEYGLPCGPDLYSWFKEHPDQLSSDGVHPNGDEYRAINRLWADAVGALYSAG
jgi:lysophospholipase L1-like esterase